MKVTFNIKKRYAWAIIGLLVLFGGLFIVNAFGGNQPAVMGHSAGELEEADPTVLASVKDGVSWDEITGKPVEVNPVITTYEGYGCGECPFSRESLHEGDINDQAAFVTHRACKGNPTGVVICNRPNCWTDGGRDWNWRMICLDYS
jgi:hypothetical protein